MEFNIALLGKWGWWMLVEPDSLWFKVLSARYGFSQGRWRGGGRHASNWWRYMEGLCWQDVC